MTDLLEHENTPNIIYLSENFDRVLSDILSDIVIGKPKNMDWTLG